MQEAKAREGALELIISIIQKLILIGNIPLGVTSSICVLLYTAIFMPFDRYRCCMFLGGTGFPLGLTQGFHPSQA